MSDHEEESGGMGVSSERVGPTGPGQVGSHGLRDTSPVETEDTDAPPEQRPGHIEHNPAHVEPKTPRPRLDPAAPED